MKEPVAHVAAYEAHLMRYATHVAEHLRRLRVGRLDAQPALLRWAMRHADQDLTELLAPGVSVAVEGKVKEYRLRVMMNNVEVARVGIDSRAPPPPINRGG